jgi:hypothetical protein
MNPTMFRASLYFAIAFLTPFSAKVLTSLDAGKWPSGQEAVAGIIGATLAGLIALRAYYDGSALRNAQEAIASVQITELKQTDTKPNT